jgi:hypothetical protein
MATAIDIFEFQKINIALLSGLISELKDCKSGKYICLYGAPCSGKSVFSSALFDVYPWLNPDNVRMSIDANRRHSLKYCTYIFMPNTIPLEVSLEVSMGDARQQVAEQIINKLPSSLLMDFTGFRHKFVCPSSTPTVTLQRWIRAVSIHYDITLDEAAIEIARHMEGKNRKEFMLQVVLSM